MSQPWFISKMESSANFIYFCHSNLCIPPMHEYCSWLRSLRYILPFLEKLFLELHMVQSFVFPEIHYPMTQLKVVCLNCPHPILSHHRSVLLSLFFLVFKITLLIWLLFKKNNIRTQFKCNFLASQTLSAMCMVLSWEYRTVPSILK